MAAAELGYVTPGGEVVLAPPCHCGAHVHLVERPDLLARLRVRVRRAIGCPEHPNPPVFVVGPLGPFVLDATWRPATWSSRPRWPFRWPWERP